MLKMIVALFVMGTVLILSACSTKTDPAEAYKGETPKQIFVDGEEDMRKANYTEAIKRFEALDIQYPLEDQTEVAELHLTYAYYRKEEYALAEAAAGRFIRLHPMSKHTDYAYFIQGLSDYYQNQGIIDRVFSVDLAKRETAQIKKAFFEFSTIVNQFPNSRYAAPAYQYMVYMRNLLAKHQLQVAEFYLDRKAYVAAINRANDVVKHYEGAPAVRPALEVMAKSYRGLHLDREEQETLALLRYNAG